MGIPAHVTILYPFVPPPAISDDVVRALADLFAGFEAFDCTFARTKRFPAGVLYLEPNPAGRFTQLTDAVWRRFPGYPPYEGAFDTVIAHLTVVDCAASDCCDDAGATLGDAERAVARGLPVSGRAADVSLYTKNERWVEAERFPLGGAT